MGQTTSGESLSSGAVMNPATDFQDKKNDGVTWWCRLLVKTVCVVAGFVAMLTGFFRLLTFTPMCLVAGIYLMLLGFIEIVLEAPCCCQFLDFIQPVSRFSESRSYWEKALVYTLPPVLAPLMCFSTTTMCGAALLMASGVIYGMIALGRKADRDTMLSRARSEQDVEMKATLVTNDTSSTLVP
ncbi:hypothetical protein EGW08_017604 [Elysia chlorotica]|uniref:Calcium channel flower n=1 Tax=Elysia chlorotica TaxID=188477 RepID=A0A433SZ94_ELYCH|nr:hypothetical protein EGW08_017604 [Elysia chlorotica]